MKSTFAQSNTHRHFARAFILASTLAAIIGAGWVGRTAPALESSVIEFARPLFTERKGRASASIVLRRTGDNKAGASVELTTSNDTAMAGLDYVPPTRPVVFAPGETEQKVALELLTNREAQGDRRLKLILSKAVDARVGVLNAAELVIADPDFNRHAWIAFGLDRIPALNRTTFEIPYWQFLASLIYIFLAFYISRLLDFVVRGRMKQWTRRTQSELDDLILELLRGPLRVVAFVILLHLGLRIFVWPDWIANFTSNALLIIVAVSLTWMVLKLIDVLTTFWKQRRVAEEDRTFAEQLLPILRNSLKVFTLVVAVLLTLQNLGLNITSLITSLGIGGLALALAAQDTLANFFGAMVILIDKPFRIGDDIQFDGVMGKIENIGFRSTRLRNLDGHLVSIPNKTVGNAVITNISQRPNIRMVFNLALAGEMPAEKVEHAAALLKEICKRQELTHDVVVTFDKFTGSAPNLVLIQWWKPGAAAKLAQLQSELNLAIKKAFDREQISLAMPLQTIYLKHAQ